MIREVKHFIGNNTIIGRFFRNIVIKRNEALRQIYHDNEIKKMRQYGLEALQVFDECVTSHGYSYSLATGTLLGAIREKGFIPHDEDIDVFMWIEDFDESLYKVLEEVGFQRQHTYTVDNGKSGREDSFLYKGVQLDIFYICPPVDEFPYFTDYLYFGGCSTVESSVKKHGGLLPRRLNLPIKKEFVRVPFESLCLPVPTNAHEVLVFRYGKDYMTPNPQWGAREANPNIVEWIGKIGKVQRFKHD